MVAVTQPFSKKHQKVITHIKKVNRRMETPKFSETLQRELIELIQALRTDIYPKQLIPFTLPDSWTFIDLFNKASQLLDYREYLGLINLNQEQYDKDYFTFGENNTIFLNALENGNLFIIQEHLIHLYNLLQVKAETPHNRENYINALTTLKVSLSAIPEKNTGILKKFLELFLEYALTQSYATADVSTPEDAIGRLSLNLANIDLGVKSAKLSLDEIEGDPFYNFYTCDFGFLKRLPFDTLDKWQEHIVSLDIVPTQVLIHNFDLARQKHNAKVENNKPTLKPSL